MPEAEEVEITTMINKCTNTQQLDEELHQQGDDTKITVLHAELANVVFQSSARTILEHGEDDIVKETTLFDSRTVFGAEEVETNTSIDLNKTPQLLDELHEHDDETGISFPSTEIMDVVEAKNIVSMVHGSSSQVDVTEETTFVNDKTMREAEDVENATVINQDRNTLQLVEELDQQGDEPKLNVLHPELINEAFESSAETILEHGEDDISKETTLFDAKTVFVAEEVETNTSIDVAPQLLDELHEQGDETGISFPSTELMDVEAKNIVSMEEANNGLQQVEEFHGSSSQVDVTEETTFVNDKTMREAEDVENATMIDQDTNTLQLVGELDQQGDVPKLNVLHAELINEAFESSAETILEHGEDDITKETTLFDAKTVFGAEEVETNTSIDLATNNTPQVLDELHEQDNETGISFPSTNLSNKVDESYAETLSEHGEMENRTSSYQAINPGELAEDLPQQVSEAELTICSVEVSQKLNVEEVKLLPNDDHDLQIVEELCQESHMDSVERDDQKHGKTNLNEKNIKIAEELKSLNLEMDEKLRKIEELAKHVLAIDTEISRMEFKCRESKGNHADFIDLYKFMAESQLPLRSHREIKLFMKKMDKAAQQFMSNALDLQFNIEARAKLKLSLQEERKELGKLIEAQKLQMQQKLNEFRVMKFNEAVVPDLVSQSIETTTNCFRKRKADHQEDLVEELRAPLQAKRMAFDVVTDP